MANLLIWQVLLQRLGAFAAVAAGQARENHSWFETATHSGALGFCADFLFGQTTGLSQAPLNGYGDMRHPAIASALVLWKEAREAEDVRAGLETWANREGDESALGRLKSTREALNGAVRHQLRDMMSPGYLPRMFNEVKSRDASAYWRSPD